MVRAFHRQAARVSVAVEPAIVVAVQAIGHTGLSFDIYPDLHSSSTLSSIVLDLFEPGVITGQTTALSYPRETGTTLCLESKQTGLQFSPESTPESI